jgi:NAD(P)-dependent dehydrogenase (short-subunit alcohol dehydrogenase family)
VIRRYRSAMDHAAVPGAGQSEAGGSPVVLVTGATGPLGRVVARRFAADGARLVLAGRDESRLRGVAVDAGLAAENWLPALGELTDADAAAAIVAAAEARFGRIDVAAHLVGGWAGGTPVVDLESDELGGMLDQHLWTTFHLVRAVLPGMTSRGFGRILAVTSPFAANPGAKGASYAVAKAAQETLLRTVAREVAGTGVTANLVVVRTIDAGHQRVLAPSPKNAAWTTPEEIAETLAFLASPAAGPINGARVPLDGRA